MTIVRLAQDTLKRSKEVNLIQNEIIAAKQIQEQEGCTWTEALRIAYRMIGGQS